LNEQATWMSYEDLIQWFSGLLGRPASLSRTAVVEFQDGLNCIRQQVSAIHFHESVDIPFIDQHLKDISLELISPISSDSAYSNALPRLRARASSSDDDALLRALKQTLIVQFAYFVSEALAQSEIPGIARCEGLYREGSSTHLSPADSLPEETELRWRKEIAALTEAGLESSTDILRCADYFLARSKARFCSDECRFRTFQLTKQLADPGYLAAKQKRYRERNEKRGDK